MAKGTIIEDHGQGRYTIELAYHTERVDRERAALTAQIGAVREQLPRLEERVQEQAARMDALEQEMSDAIIAKNLTAMQRIHGRISALQKSIFIADADLAMQRLKLTALERRRDRLASLPTAVNIEAWCADHTEGMSGAVGTVEVARGTDGGTVILPGHNGWAAYDAQRDGMLQEPRASGAAGAFYNYAMLPGAAKWRPRYRLGEIRAIDATADTCTVDLNPCLATHQRIAVNQAETLTDVPVRYMTCNAGAFEEGDRVVVRFDGLDWGQPTVIGFVREPRLCPNYLLIILRGTPVSVPPQGSSPGDEQWCLVFDAATGNPADIGMEQPLLLSDFNAVFEAEDATQPYIGSYSMSTAAVIFGQFQQVNQTYPGYGGIAGSGWSYNPSTNYASLPVIYSLDNAQGRPGLCQSYNSAASSLYARAEGNPPGDYSLSQWRFAPLGTPLADVSILSPGAEFPSTLKAAKTGSSDYDEGSPGGQGHSDMSMRIKQDIAVHNPDKKAYAVGGPPDFYLPRTLVVSNDGHHESHYTFPHSRPDGIWHGDDDETDQVDITASWTTYGGQRVTASSSRHAWRYETWFFDEQNGWEDIAWRGSRELDADVLFGDGRSAAGPHGVATATVVVRRALTSAQEWHMDTTATYDLEWAGSFTHGDPQVMAEILYKAQDIQADGLPAVGELNRLPNAEAAIIAAIGEKFQLRRDYPDWPTDTNNPCGINLRPVYVEPRFIKIIGRK
ncbi:MAG: hypothetical protein GX570_02420 [Corynebacterium marinum]|uniref:Uncharacterized protein n=1 Tax=Corynebacterium marinum TaxID=349751 RepID=A0A847H8H7_9CORY|nr:hypothetical protein [Corynebacterium marinum]